MIDLYFSPTPNGLKIRLFLEETRLPYRIVPVSLSRGEQFEQSFLAISPNGKMPAIVDHAPASETGTAALPVFESGAILLYLAEKTGCLLGSSAMERVEIVQWLFWQMAGLGPMAGQSGYFRVYAGEQVPFAIERYTKETARLYRVLDTRLADRPFVGGSEYSIADIACYPWIVPHDAHGQDLREFPHLQRWFETVRARPATQRVYEGVADVYTKPGAPVQPAATSRTQQS
ncbi:glutathione binding-like protein [Paraburkholderia sp.]|uniref:glutathione binding-like protein n=1 Tax=Paraburkholderia sp. TaxID=1926495 RepID=UPI003D6ED800